MLYTLFTLATFFIMPGLSFAQEPQLVPASCVSDVRACDFCALLQMAKNIIDLLFKILVIAAVILIVWAGIKLVTSAGNTHALEDAKSMVTNVIIGFVIVMAAWLIVDTIFKMLVKDTDNFGVWNELSGVNCGGVQSVPLPGTGTGQR